MPPRSRFFALPAVLLPALLLPVAAPSLAQVVTRGGVLPAGAPQSTNADLLTRHLRELADDPENIVALKGAGGAALAIGDANAALAFYARAERLAPRDGAVKAGLARAMLKAENPRDALKLFDDATDEGVADADVAGDRGLAHDLRGEPRKAQKDYALALARRPDDEITRRYALSLAISGDRESALKLLEPMIYRRDAGAWRARAFVLALTGDAAGAGKIVTTMMPGMAPAMQPFLVRLATLKPVEKALAVHLGQFPSDGPRYAASDVAEPKRAVVARADERLVPTGDAFGTRVAAATPSSAITRAPSPARVPAARPTPTPAAPRLAVASPSAAPKITLAPPRASVTPSARTKLASGPPDGAKAPVRMTPASRSGLLAEIIRNIKIPETELIASAAEPSSSPTPRKLAQVRAAAADPKLASTAIKPAAKKPVVKKPPPPPREPARIWVQVAGGARKADLPKSWAALRAKAPAALKGQGAWTTPLRATNRLLAGPFASEEKAQAFVNTIGKAGISGFVFSSAEGQAIERLAVK